MDTGTLQAILIGATVVALFTPFPGAAFFFGGILVLSMIF